MANLGRSVIVDLLNRLGDERDEAALAAARELHRIITDEGATWDDLLIPDSSSLTEDDQEQDFEDTIDEPVSLDAITQPDGVETEGLATVPSDEPLAANPQEAARAIERMLARKGLSKEARDELAAFKRDIAEERLTEMDSRYIEALARRLGA